MVGVASLKSEGAFMVLEMTSFAMFKGFHYGFKRWVASLKSKGVAMVLGMTSFARFDGVIMVLKRE